MLVTTRRLAALAFAAMAPFQIYYAQEARMYMLMALLAALSVWLLDTYLRQPVGSRAAWRTAGAWVPITAALLYTQYFAFSVVLFEALVFVATLPRCWRAWRFWAIWGGANLLVAALYLPWLSQTFQQISGWPSISEAFTLPELLRRVFLVFSFGLSWDNTATTRMVAAFVGLALAGLATGLWQTARGRGRGFWLLAGYLLMPVLVMYLLSLRKPLYNPKFLLLAAPAYALWLGLGVAGLAQVVAALVARLRAGALAPRLAGGTVALALLAVAGYGVSRSAAAYYFDPKYQRDDYRGLARLIMASEAAGDAIILNAPG
ncbi:MAG: hypothetical protein K6U89_19820, partial [Chloroflexi bacterium]|nr:hypothetical protein [Chloroflexota bacterium]